MNGSQMEIMEGTTVSDLLKILEIGNGPIAVEQNLEIVSKSDYTNRAINDGDKIEIVHFVGGG
ncbi:MAG TPA: sulfur carrier protein ThiS [Acidobacteriota bacterium]